ncbi:Metallo-dependent hydrolase [Metschnikowia bicuspidata var. bicuspidata NRRL YB-4993]|uniref:Metallo-dependent hydrolase n=1 Tax=Metschnikowia bicuspidata var. bicuspidata NRRL YB-4993 TaxID=869754 RepID=A0A1A0HCU4_9ASCO|nr:Metallo-dependent hydrolase [Metschnikowia bicuspidata var. bicuspidata NRRL YB-4993]OBA21743.1 Metallo-dependent hydrolase [Metschnikowia bicuspidata var. bicuspidata NRRL YB-4993]
MYYMDCHCHLGVDAHLRDSEQLMQKLNQDRRISSEGFFNVMSTNRLDLEFLAALINLDESNILVPHFGIHPWYSHLFSIDPSLSKIEHYSLVLSSLPEDLLDLLPDPIYLEDHIQKIMELTQICHSMRKAYAIGEIGLDKLFRIPSNGFYGNQDFKTGVKLTAAKVLMEHQRAVFVRQLELANRLEKPVSLHCVKAHGPFFDIVHSSFLEIPSVTLHSYTGSPDQAMRWVKEFSKQRRNLYFSFSNFINGEGDRVASLSELTTLIPEDHILFETDMPIDRYFLSGREDEYFEQLYKIQAHISKSKGVSEAECNLIVQKNSLSLHLS